MKAEVISAELAVRKVRDRDCLIVGSNGGTGAPESLLQALEEQFLATGTPNALTLFHVTGIGAGTSLGLCHLAHKGLVERVFGGNYGLQLPLMSLITVGEVEGYNFPRGVVAQLCRAMAAKQPASSRMSGCTRMSIPGRKEGA